MRDRRVLPLDSGENALDTHSEAHVQSALTSSVKGRPLLLLANRLLTMPNTDHIVAMDQGRIVEVGSRADLVALGGHYARVRRAPDV